MGWTHPPVWAQGKGSINLPPMQGTLASVQCFLATDPEQLFKQYASVFAHTSADIGAYRLNQTLALLSRTTASMNKLSSE